VQVIRKRKFKALFEAIELNRLKGEPFSSMQECRMQGMRECSVTMKNGKMKKILILSAKICGKSALIREKQKQHGQDQQSPTEILDRG